MRQRVVRILLVDSSPSLFRHCTTALAALRRNWVLDRAVNSRDAQDVILSTRPDVIVLNLELAKGDGLALLRRLRRAYPVPVFVIGAPGPEGHAIKAIELGALEAYHRPALEPVAVRSFMRLLCHHIEDALTSARPVSRAMSRVTADRWADGAVNSADWVIAVGASTGGVQTIRALLGSFSADAPPIVIVQHMLPGFTESFAARLDEFCPQRVRHAEDGMPLQVGEVLIAPANMQVKLAGRLPALRCMFDGGYKVNRHCPSADVLFESAAEVAASRAIGILLTGMGSDGARGLLTMREAGAMTLAQSQETSVIFGMPRAAIQLGAAQHVAGPLEMPGIILREAGARSGVPTTATPRFP